MRRSRGILLTAAVTVLLLALVALPASARGHTAAQLEKAGYECFHAGPISTNWIHCWKEKHVGNPSIPVKVFSEDGSEFLGTEQLLRNDVYNGQPCPQDGLETWEAVPGMPYFACHHFHTGHH